MLDRNRRPPPSSHPGRPAGSHAPTSLPPGGAGCSRRRGPVLYISDDPESRILFTRMARRWQTVRLLLSETGRGGLRLALVRRPDVIVLDDRLPDAAGADVLGQLRHLLTTVSTPVVVIGSTTAPAHRASLLGSGAAHYLTKPLHIAELERTVGTLLELAAMR